MIKYLIYVSFLGLLLAGCQGNAPKGATDSPATNLPVLDVKADFLADDAGLQVGYKSDRWRRAPHNCYTIVRVNFDRWFAKKAEEAERAKKAREAEKAREAAVAGESGKATAGTDQPAERTEKDG